MSRRSDASSPGGGSLRMVTGTYTGNGAATQAIVGVGFQPRYMIAYPQTDALRSWFFKSDVMAGGFSNYFAGANALWRINVMISLDADGFTVGNGTSSNNLGIIYTYIAFR